MSAQVLALPAYDLAQPFLDSWIVHVVIVDPALVARIVRRINIDALDLSLIPGQQGLECFQIIPTDNHVFACLGVICILLLQYPVRDLQVVVDYFVFSNPFKCGHLCDLLYRYVDDSIGKW